MSWGQDVTEEMSYGSRGRKGRKDGSGTRERGLLELSGRPRVDVGFKGSCGDWSIPSDYGPRIPVGDDDRWETITFYMSGRNKNKNFVSIT